MKVLIRKSLDDIGWEASLKDMTDYCFPVIYPIAEERGFIDHVSSRDYHNINEFFSARFVIELLDKDNEFVIKTKADYDKFVVMVNDYLEFGSYGANLGIGVRIKEDAE